MVTTLASCSLARLSCRRLGCNRGTRLAPSFSHWRFSQRFRPRAAGQPTSNRTTGAVLGLPGDVCLAGSIRQVSSALQRLTAARQVGLALNPPKCELVTCSDDGLVDPALFPAGIVINRSGAFSYLGAPVGNMAFCKSYTLTTRVDAHRPLLLVCWRTPKLAFTAAASRAGPLQLRR